MDMTLKFLFWIIVLFWIVEHSAFSSASTWVSSVGLWIQPNFGRPSLIVQMLSTLKEACMAMCCSLEVRYCWETSWHPLKFILDAYFTMLA